MHSCSTSLPNCTTQLNLQLNNLEQLTIGSSDDQELWRKTLIHHIQLPNRVDLPAEPDRKPTSSSYILAELGVI